MPYSGSPKTEPPGAIAPVIWYLLNLLALPIIGFVVLLTIAMKSGDAHALRRAHSKAAVYMSILGAMLISSGVAVCWFIYGNTGLFWTYAIVWAVVLVVRTLGNDFPGSGNRQQAAYVSAAIVVT